MFGLPLYIFEASWQAKALEEARKRREAIKVDNAGEVDAMEWMPWDGRHGWMLWVDG